VIEKLSATASDPAFRDSILPRARRAYLHAFYAVRPYHIGDLLAKLGITIQDRVAVRIGFRKGFSQLLQYPGPGWVFRDVEMENLASIVFDDEETIQDSKSEGRHGEEVHGRDDFAVIAQESSPEFPCLLGRRQAPDVARNCAFFKNEELINYLTALQVQHSLYEYVVYESEVEREFARKLDQREDIKLFVKLPSWFEIDTPVGKYNPDWAILKHDGQAVYLVRETKGTKDFLKLRTTEADKVRCGQRHFEMLGVPFAVAVTADEV
jgi:hypothetical protein